MRCKNDFINIIKSSWGRIIMILLNIYQLYSTELTKKNRCLIQILTQKQILKQNTNHQRTQTTGSLHQRLGFGSTPQVLQNLSKFQVKVTDKNSEFGGRLKSKLGRLSSFFMQFNTNNSPKMASILSPLFGIQQIHKKKLSDKFQ